MCDREESTQGIPQRDAIAQNKERGFQICEWREEEEEKRQAKNKKEASTWYLGHAHTNKYYFALLNLFLLFAFSFVSFPVNNFYIQSCSQCAGLFLFLL